ncbi:MAG: carbohydrate binding family 9 domain-containing protein [Acidobacteria bacterium]|nr:carbohydrate binding family 9 domain-containing protein [Acidobacteriota bacterium]
MIQQYFWRAGFIVLFLFLGLGMERIAWTQTNGRQNAGTHGSKIVRAVATENPVVVDGNLDDAIWRAAAVASGFLQKDPREGEVATEPTEFRVAYTPTVLYIGVTAYDSDPRAILANERRRDGDLGDDDNVTIVLDTFHDHRNSFRFTTNPLGTQQDALVTDEGNTTNENWDEKWDVGARITETGWTAEFAIPFKSVRVPESEDGMTWGLDMQRFIRRKNESTSWANYRRGFDIANVSQAGHLSGLSAIETGLRLRVKPYLLGGFSHTTDQARSQICRSSDTAPATTTGSTFCNASDAGIEVMKFRINPSLTADFTWKTDFAQTEVDNQQINLDRFPLFFPEKREFFQEGAGIFEFGIAQNENQGAVSKVFHSRQIGLSPRRFPVPIVAGGRITGKLLGFGVGLMNVQTERYDPEHIRASNYSVARIKRDVLGRSTIGAFFLNRELGGLDDFTRVYGLKSSQAALAPCLQCPDYNRVFGADANFVFYRYLSVGGFFGKSQYPRLAGDQGDDWITAATLRWDSDQFNVETSWHSVDPKFRDDMGFVPRPDQRMISPQLAIRLRINSDLIRQLIFRYRVDYTMNSNNHLETRVGHSAFEIRFQDGGQFGWVPHNRFDTFYTPFTLRSGMAIIPEGSYSWWNNGLRYNLAPQRRISGQIFNWAHHIGYFGRGSRHDLDINPRIRITNQVSTQISYGINKFHFPVEMCVDKTQASGCGFTDQQLSARVNFNFNNQWLTSTILQYNNADDLWGLNIRLNYIFRPGDDFFLIYTEGRQGPSIFQDGHRVDDLARQHNDRTIQAKLTYSFDF